ncbi:MAG TPA: bifunctional UDP-N-acetylglucosamine diphosphorylase/glucosamine-1-phosphate N-acetyltransferase GlmU [Acidimicrobiia bacterium]|nr:bifunctional UDP-N-acetylglucosamine diphosphorylase/glucosamine-1-phosphate N-acetyltransferase GlmU [Acidimicrobiia bacterium]
MPTHVIILAAGEGKRMKSDLPKVAHRALGRSLVNHVIAAASTLGPASTVVVVGHGAEQVRSILPEGIIDALQAEQLGTGHATQIGLDALGPLDPDDTVMILYGDTPLLTPGLLDRLADLDEGESARLISSHLSDPSGYGRVVRDGSGRITGIVEHRDCSPEQLGIDEVNAGIYAVKAGRLSESLKRVTNDNAQGEYYLTDVIGILVAEGDRLSAVEASPEEVMGINSQDQLAVARKELRMRINQRLMESGVEILDPEHTYIDEEVKVEPGARIYPGTHLEGATTIGAGSEVGPDVFAVDSTIGANTKVWYAVLRGAQIGSECEVGPYASLRPGSVLEDGSKIGTFVETKNTVMGEGAKANHLSYLGDADVGARTNIGAGVVTVNYDGVKKSKTEIGEDAFIGSDTMLVAPVKVGDRGTTGAGSVITKDVGDDALAIERSDQREIPGYAQKREARKAAENAED